MLSSYICAVDIGSSKIASSVASIRNKRIRDIYFESAPDKSVRAGAVMDAVSLVGALNKVLKQLKAKSGINIKSVCVNVSGSEVVARHSFGVIPLAERGNKVITLSDVHKVNDQALALAANLEEEVIDQMPVSYSIDSRGGIANPLGLYSHRLEVDLYLISARLSSMQNIGRIVNQAGYEMTDMYFSGSSTSRVVMGRDNQSGINVFCDIGSDITELIIFTQGVASEIIILPLGGDAITLELADALKIPLDLAESTKQTYGKVADTDRIEEGKEILIKKDDTYKAFSQRSVCELITRRSRVICEEIGKNLRKKTDPAKVNNFVCVGRTILLEGFLEALENTLGVGVKVGRVSDPDIMAKIYANEDMSGQKYLNYLTSLGMIAQVLKNKDKQLIPSHESVARNPFFKAIDRIKEVYEEYF